MKLPAALFGLLAVLLIIAADLGFRDFVHRIHDIPLADKVGHFALYGMLNLLAILAVGEWRPAWGARRIALVSTASLVLVAGLEEISQLYIPARTFSIWDFASGTAGILVFGAAEQSCHGGNNTGRARVIRDRRA